MGTWKILVKEPETSEAWFLAKRMLTHQMNDPPCTYAPDWEEKSSLLDFLDDKETRPAQWSPSRP